jgi:signal transduction histidine kinase
MSLAEERERRRLAVELHDQITQKLILFKINLGSLMQRELPTELAKPLNEIYQHLDQIIQDTRTLTFDLSSLTLYELGLEAAVREWLYDEVREKHGIHTEFEDDGQPKPLNDDVRVLLYRAARELLVNIVKHAQAQKVKVCIGRDNDNVRVEVVDDGIGFVPSLQLNKTGGFGLFSIRERLNYLGGSIEIESKPNQGTHVTLTAPIKRGKIENNEVQGGHHEHDKNFSGG